MLTIAIGRVNFNLVLNSTNFYENIADGKVLVKFEASWCGPCKAYAPTFKQFSEENESIKCFSVDCGDHKDIADDFEIRSIPITILFIGLEEIDFSDLWKSGIGEIIILFLFDIKD